MSTNFDGDFSRYFFGLGEEEEKTPLVIQKKSRPDDLNEYEIRLPNGEIFCSLAAIGTEGLSAALLMAMASMGIEVAYFDE